MKAIILRQKNHRRLIRNNDSTLCHLSRNLFFPYICSDEKQKYIYDDDNDDA